MTARPALTYSLHQENQTYDGSRPFSKYRRRRESMTRKRKDVQYVEVSGRLVPEDTTTPRRRMAEIAVVVALAICFAILAPLIV